MNASEPEPTQNHAVQLQALFVRHQTSIKAFILSLRPDFSTVDDILQETFLTVTRKADDFRADSNFLSWVFAIARFKVLEVNRSRRSETALSEEAIEMLAADAPSADFFDNRLPALLSCLDRLAPRAREIVRLRYHGECGPGEIAQRLKWRVAAVNVALSRARERLRRCVQMQREESA